MEDSGPRLPGSVDPEEGKEALPPKTQDDLDSTFKEPAQIPEAPDSSSDGKPRLRKVHKVWPELKGTAISKLQDHELPGDDFVSLRYKSRRNYQPLCFLPCVFLAFTSDSAVLCHETRAVLSDGENTCMWGEPARDLFTGQKYCPAIAGLSGWQWSAAWYGVFLITCLITWCRGRSMHKQRKHAQKDQNDQQSYICTFLDCERAGYTDKHLKAWFAVMTLCFVNSLSIRFVATPDGHEMLDGNACLRYGDWTGHWDHCQPGGLLEPSWAVVLLGVFLCFAAALMDQGSIRWDPDSAEWCRFREVDRITGAAIKLKALVRRQMNDTRLEQMDKNSSLAEFMWGPVNGLNFMLGFDGDGEESFSIRLGENFQDDLSEIFDFKLEAPKKWPEASKEEELKRLHGPCCPEITLRAQAHLHNRMAGNQSPQAWEAEQKEFQKKKDWQKDWMKPSDKIDIEKIYDWCKVLESYRDRQFGRSMTSILEEKKKQEDQQQETGKSCPNRCAGLFRGHQVLGFFLGLLGAYIFCFMAPQGDSYAWFYYAVPQEELVQERCQITNSTDGPSPWCSTFEYLLMSRTTLWTSHGTMSYITRNVAGVVFCAATKFIICGTLSALLASTVFKTVRGLEQAAHPMLFLDAILMWWSRTDQISTCHLHVWKLARDSLLHNDVKNILDRYENVVLAYLAVSFWLVTDSAIQVALFNNAPNIMAAFVFAVFFMFTVLCGHQALRVHYAQSQHVHTLSRLREATYLHGASPDAEHQRKLIEVMMSRLSKDGGDYQTRLLYIPLNPNFQKAIMGWFFTAVLAVIIRLVGETFVAAHDRHPRALDSLNQTSTTVAPYMVRILP